MPCAPVAADGAPRGPGIRVGNVCQAGVAATAVPAPYVIAAAATSNHTHRIPTLNTCASSLSQLNRTMVDGVVVLGVVLVRKTY